MKTYQEALEYLDDKKWPNLSVDQKIEILQCVENELAKRSRRIPCEVKAEELNQGVLGEYSFVSQDIKINVKDLQKGSKYTDDYMEHLDTILHEGRHAYQDQAIRGYVIHPDPQEVEKWKMNLKPGNYISSNDLFEEYCKQPVEADADRFAKEMTQSVIRERYHIIRENLEKEYQHSSDVNIDFLREKYVKQHTCDSNTINENMETHVYEESAAKLNGSYRNLKH